MLCSNQIVLRNPEQHRSTARDRATGGTKHINEMSTRRTPTRGRRMDGYGEMLAQSHDHRCERIMAQLRLTEPFPELLAEAVLGSRGRDPRFARRLSQVHGACLAKVENANAASEVHENAAA